MAQVSIEDAANQVRRQKCRLPTTLPAQLTTMYGTENVVLHDLSLTGARIGEGPRRTIEEPLRDGLDAVLTWQGHEVFGQIIWAAIGSAGIVFEERISTKVLLETRALQDRVSADGGLDSFNKQAAENWASGGSRI